MGLIIGIDPGPVTSGAVLLDGLRVLRCDGAATVDEIASWVASGGPSVRVVCEDLSPRAGGTPSQIFSRWGQTIATAKVIGRVEQLCASRGWRLVEIHPATWRRDLTGNPGATPAQIGACVREVYERAGLATGGGAEPAKGTKGQPGPLYGLRGKTHALDALGCALAWLQEEDQR